MPRGIKQFTVFQELCYNMLRVRSGVIGAEAQKHKHQLTGYLLSYIKDFRHYSIGSAEV